jgi:hypothetical protein
MSATIKEQVMRNGVMLDPVVKELLGSKRGKYIVFHEGKYAIANDFPSAQQLGESLFGSGTGFAIRLIEDTQPMLSEHVTL